jgi:hypothetical protein
MMANMTLNTQEWGRLVKSWATGDDYVDTPPAQQPPVNRPVPHDAAWGLPKPERVAVTTGAVTGHIPKAWVLTADEAKAKMAAANVVVSPDSGFDKLTHFVIVQGDEHTMVLRLPSAHRLRESEDALIKAGPHASYGLPSFYDDLYATFTDNIPHQAPSPATREEKMRLHANRIADYSMSQCR